ncbi:MAG: hypothetical protein Alis3KO_06130 [Aliiglaciecola sp.]
MTEKVINTLIWIAILMAILWVFWTGSIIHKQPDRTQLIAAIWDHVGFAVVWLLPVLTYVLFLKTRQSKGSLSQVVKVLDNLFWLTLGVLFVTGFFTVWARGSDIKVFDWFIIPSPVERMQTLYETLEASHGAISQFFIAIGLAWLGSKLYHFFSQR